MLTSWLILILFVNLRKKEISKRKFLMVPFLFYFIELGLLITIGILLIVFSNSSQTIYTGTIVSGTGLAGLAIGNFIGYRWGKKQLRKSGLLCDNDAYKDLERRKNDINNKINNAKDTRTKQVLKICEASITDDYSYWTAPEWMDKLKQGLSGIKLYDSTDAYEALLCLALENKAFSYIKAVVILFDDAGGKLYSGYNKDEIIKILNNAWNNFLHKEWLNDPQVGNDSDCNIDDSANNADIDKSTKTVESSNIQSSNVKDYIFCRKCGSKMPKDSLFCSSCGEKFIIISDKCSYCGEKLLDGAKFCNKCGKAVM